MGKICSVIGCKRKSSGRGFCNSHYMKWWRYGDPLYVLSPEELFKRRSEGQKGRIFTPEARKNMSEAQKKIGPHPNSVAALRKHNIAIRGLPLKPSTIEKMKKSLAKKWKEPEHQSKMKLVRKKFMSNPKVRTKISQSVKKLWDDPEYVKNQITKQKQFHKENPEAAKIQSIKVQKWLKEHPEFREQASQRRAKMKFPFKDSKPELLTQSILQKHNISFKKHKNFKLSNSNHQADIVIEPNLVIEIFGDYWHCNPKKYDGESNHKLRRNYVKVKDVWKYDKYIIDGMKEQGYNVLVVWESELKNELEKTTEKILKFVRNVR